MPLLVTQCNVTKVEEDVEKLEEDDDIGPILQDDDEFREVSNKLTDAQDRLKILRSLMYVYVPHLDCHLIRHNGSRRL